MNRWQGSILVYGTNRHNREKLLRRIIENIQGTNAKEGANLVIIQTEGSIGIDSIRYLENQIRLKPQASQMKVAVLRNCQNLTQEAQNALLKTLEEPPPSTVIILETGQKETLAETITSRCQLLFASDVIDYLPTPAEQEQILRENRTIIFGNIAEKFELAQKLSSEAPIWIDKEIYFWRDLVLAKYTCQELIVHQKIKENLKLWAKKLTKKEITAYLGRLIKIRKLLLQNIGKRLALEILFLEAPKLE